MCHLAHYCNSKPCFRVRSYAFLSLTRVDGLGTKHDAKALRGRERVNLWARLARGYLSLEINWFSLSMEL